jgi:hypothetical protein
LERWGYVVVAFIIGLVAGSFLEWPGCGKTVTRDSTVVTRIELYAPPPPPQIIRGRAVPFADWEQEHPVYKERIDSLLAAIASRDSADAVKDSLIKALAAPKLLERAIRWAAPDGLEITGHVTTMFFPLTEEFVEEARLDTIKVPVEVTTISETLTKTIWPWPWIAAFISAGIAFGLWLGAQI